MENKPPNKARHVESPKLRFASALWGASALKRYIPSRIRLLLKKC